MLYRSEYNRLGPLFLPWLGSCIVVRKKAVNQQKIKNQEILEEYVSHQADFKFLSTNFIAALILNCFEVIYFRCFVQLSVSKV